MLLPKKTAWIILLLVVAGATGGFLILRQKKLPPSTPSNVIETLPEEKTTSAYKIENVPYTYGWTGCCYCTGMTAMMGYWGMDKEKVENYWQDIKATNYEKDPVIFIRLLPKYGLSNKFHVAWLNPEGLEPRFMNLWKQFLADYKKQVHYLKSEDEAFIFLKRLISQDTPVMVGYEEDTKGTYQVVYGYDENHVYYWTLPGKATQDTTEKFLKMWKMPGEEFPYPNFPGHYLMMWLER